MSAALGLRRTGVLLITMTATSILAVSTAQAWMTAQGTGSGAATSTTGPLGITASANGAVDGLLLPGGTGDLVLTVNNPNDFAVRITSLAAGGTVVVSNAAGTCSPSSVAVAVPAAQLPVTVAPGSTPLRFTGAAVLAANADQGCQGASFQIPLAIGARR